MFSAAAILAPLSGAAFAQKPLKIALLGTYSDPYADYDRHFDAGVALYLRENGGKFAGRSVEIIKKDTASIAPDASKHIAQELVVRDNVQILTGLDFSPNASAVAAVATQAKISTVVMNGSSSAINGSSPYVARLSFTVQQVYDPMARGVLRTGTKEAYVVVADYASGKDSLNASKKAFEQGGANVLGGLRTPMNNPDFSA